MYLDPAEPILGQIKGDPVRVFNNQSRAAIGDIAVCCDGFNAVNVQVYVTGTGPSATVSVEGAADQGANYLPLNDPNASQTVTANASFDVVVGTRWAKIRLASVSGTFASGQGYTVYVTPYVSPGQPRVRTSVISIYDGETEVVRFGDLNGNWGYAAETYGVAIGEYASNKPNLTYDPTNGLRIRNYTTDVLTLDNSGNASIAGVLHVGASGEIRQGTGALGTDFTGLRVWHDTGIGRIAGYNADVPQWYAGTDGKLYAGAGNVALDVDGILLPFTAGNNAALFLGAKTVETPQGRLLAHNNTTYATVILSAFGEAGAEWAEMNIELDTFSGFRLNHQGLAGPSAQVFAVDTDGAGTFLSDLTTKGGLNVGTATGAGAGEGKFSGDVTVAKASAKIEASTPNATTPPTLKLGQTASIAWLTYLATTTGHYTIGIEGGETAINIGRSGTAIDTITIENGHLKIVDNVGFYNTAPQSKQTVTGSRGGNAALASLLTALATYGLITDSSTA